MAIQDLFHVPTHPASSYPPSRVRKMLQALDRKLKHAPSNVTLIAGKGGVEADKARLVAEVRGALAEYTKLDDLEHEVAVQRHAIDNQLLGFLELLAMTNQALRLRKRKPRRRLTPREEVQAAAMRGLTRLQRGTLGKRQREKLAPGRRRRR